MNKNINSYFANYSVPPRKKSWAYDLTSPDDDINTIITFLDPDDIYDIIYEVGDIFRRHDSEYFYLQFMSQKRNKNGLTGFAYNEENVFTFLNLLLDNKASFAGIAITLFSNTLDTELSISTNGKLLFKSHSPEIQREFEDVLSEKNYFHTDHLETTSNPVPYFVDDKTRKAFRALWRAYDLNHITYDDRDDGLSMA